MHNIEQISFDTITITPNESPNDIFIVKKFPKTWCVLRKEGDGKPTAFPPRRTVRTSSTPPDECEHDTADHAVAWVTQYIEETHNALSTIVERHKQ